MQWHFYKNSLCLNTKVSGRNKLVSNLISKEKLVDVSGTIMKMLHNY
jgi:hypothetical protein